MRREGLSIISCFFFGSSHLHIRNASVQIGWLEGRHGETWQPVCMINERRMNSSYFYCRLAWATNATNWDACTPLSISSMWIIYSVHISLILSLSVSLPLLSLSPSLLAPDMRAIIC